MYHILLGIFLEEIILDPSTYKPISCDILTLFMFYNLNKNITLGSICCIHHMNKAKNTNLFRKQIYESQKLRPVFL